MKITKKFKGVLGLALSAMLTLGTVSVNAETADSKNPVLPEEGRPGSITIHKYGMESLDGQGNHATGLEDPSQVPAGAVPLKGISFTVQEVVVKENGDITVSNSTDKYELVEGKETITVTTDENGKAETGEIPQGIYLVTELPNTSVTTPVAPFIVNVPMSNVTTGNGWIYDVHVYPKNVLSGNTSIDKDVTSEGNKHDTSDIGKNVTWIIKPSIPQDVYHSKKYEVYDDISNQLNYTGNLEVYYYNNEGQKVTIDEKYYTKQEPKINDENVITGPTWNQRVSVSFNKEGREFLGSLFAEGINSIRISFTTVINEFAQLGTAIPNNAVLDYQNSFSTEEEPSAPVEVPEDKRPEVHTGGVKLIKVDANNVSTTLPGAEFMIYASEEDAKAGVNPLNKPGTNEPWVEVSDDDGYVSFKGLHYGANQPATGSNSGSTEYWIVETKAPSYVDEKGETRYYNLLKAPLKVTVSASSYEDKNIVQVKNSKFSLPMTGGVGTVIFTLGGLAIMGAAAFLYMRTTRRA